MRHNVLTAKAVAAQSKPGYYTDGVGLILQVSSSLSKSWIFRYTVAAPERKSGKRTREMGLGSVRDVSLAQARQKATKCRQLLLDGKDPIEQRNALAAAARHAAKHSILFDEAADKFMAANRAGWKNDKHVEQWRSTLTTYVAPYIGSLPVEDVDTALVLKALQPIWTTKNETASRLRGRIEKILDWAAVAGYRTGDNPARWRGHLEHLLPPPSKVQKVAHHPALPYGEIASFFSAIAAQEGVAARALEFAILTATRTNEVIAADWREVDANAKLWTIPPTRMKAGKEHRVPLSSSAMEILSTTPQDQRQGYVFPGAKSDKPLSNMAMLTVLKRMGRMDITVHGFRSTFRDWAGEQSAYPREVIEHALAHQLANKAEAAYQRGDLLRKRSGLMEDWAAICRNSADE